MQGTKWLSAAVLSATVGVVGCGDPMSPDKPDRAKAPDEATVVQLEPRHKIVPFDTDPKGEIRDPRWQSEHYVWLDRGRDHRDKLFVHMPGSPALRDAWRYMLGADGQDEDGQDE
jgi:hypothetical protein